jgi:hypothetical protein
VVARESRDRTTLICRKVCGSTGFAEAVADGLVALGHDAARNSTPSRLEPDACGESRLRVEELDLPGQLPGDPEAGTESLAWREIAGRWLIEAVTLVADLADESSPRASDTDLADAAAFLHRIVRNLGDGEQQVELIALRRSCRR